MKKLIFILGTLITVTLVSCKKDYDCICTTTITNGSTTYTQEEKVASYKATRKSAEKSCTSNNTSSRTCDLK